MKYEDIAEIKEGQVFICKNCRKKIIQGSDRVHFISEPEFFSSDKPLKENAFENVEPYCEKCHNEIFGMD